MLLMVHCVSSTTVLVVALAGRECIGLSLGVAVHNIVAVCPMVKATNVCSDNVVLSLRGVVMDR